MFVLFMAIPINLTKAQQLNINEYNRLVLKANNNNIQAIHKLFSHFQSLNEHNKSAYWLEKGYNHGDTSIIEFVNRSIKNNLFWTIEAEKEGNIWIHKLRKFKNYNDSNDSIPNKIKL